MSGSVLFPKHYKEDSKTDRNLPNLHTVQTSCFRCYDCRLTCGMIRQGGFTALVQPSLAVSAGSTAVTEEMVYSSIRRDSNADSPHLQPTVVETQNCLSFVEPSHMQSEA